MSRGSSYEGTFAHVGSLLDTCKHCRKASSGNWWCSLLRKTQLVGFHFFLHSFWSMEWNVWLVQESGPSFGKKISQAWNLLAVCMSHFIWILHDSLTPCSLYVVALTLGNRVDDSKMHWPTAPSNGFKNHQPASVILGRKRYIGVEVDFGSNESLAEPFFWCRVGFLYPGKMSQRKVSGECRFVKCVFLFESYHFICSNWTDSGQPSESVIRQSIDAQWELRDAGKARKNNQEPRFYVNFSLLFRS